MDRTVTIDGKTVTLRASALIPRLYRHLIGRDVIQDMTALRRSFEAAEAAAADAEALGEEAQADASNAAALSAMDLEIFENIAWVMLKHAAEFRDVGGARVLMNGDMVVGGSPDEWLDSMDGIFSVFEVLPVILELWAANQQTTSFPAKK